MVTIVKLNKLDLSRIRISKTRVATCTTYNMRYQAEISKVFKTRNINKI